jgi:hypothetical protein
MRQEYRRKIRRLWIESISISLAIVAIGFGYFIVKLEDYRMGLTLLSTRKECENFVKFAISSSERSETRGPISLTIRPMKMRVDAITDQIYGFLTRSKVGLDLFKISVDYEPLSEEHLRQP